MSNLDINGRISAEHVLFFSARFDCDLEASRQGVRFGGQAASVLIGPDIGLPGGTTNNPPTANGRYWNILPGRGRPQLTFTEDGRVKWKRGHLVNGEWGGPGHDWRNLTPLTSKANTNHKTVEAYMKDFCAASLSYDENGPYKADWIGIAYMVQCSQDCYASVPRNADLYSYAPAFIKVSWRAVAIAKPNFRRAPGNVRGDVVRHLDGAAVLQNINNPFPFAVPARPRAIAGAAVPGGNAAGGAVFNAMPGFPAAVANGFDGDIEVHQE